MPAKAKYTQINEMDKIIMGIILVEMMKMRKYNSAFCSQIKSTENSPRILMVELVNARHEQILYRNFFNSILTKKF